MKNRPVGRPKIHANNAARCRAYRKRLKRSVHFRSASDRYETPQALFDQWNAVFHFTVDVCALPENAKCDRYFTPDQDGLQQEWGGEICWMNPPYGRVIAQWVQKAYEASKAGALVVCLLPSRTDTYWWQRYIVPLPPEDIHFLPGRQKFSGKGPAPFPSAVIVFRPYQGYHRKGKE